MSLPIAWVEKIFTKLTLIYGRDFVARWEGLSIADVKTDWGHELAGFAEHPEAIAYALQNMPLGKPPTVLEFRAIARKAPMPERKLLPEPQADPERLKRELSKLGETRAKSVETAARYDPKDWARRIIHRHTAGEKITPITLRFANEALGIKPLKA